MKALRRPSLARNVVSNWIGTFGTIAYSIAITPIVVRALTKDVYGVWSFANAVLAYSDLLYLGLGSALIRYVAEYRARGDAAAVNHLASVTLTVYTILGLVALGGAALLGAFAPGLFADASTFVDAHDISMTCLLLGLRLLTVFVGSVFSGVLIGQERLDIANIVPISFIALRLVVVPVAVSGSRPLLHLALAITTLAACEMVASIALALAFVPGLRVRFAIPATRDLRLLYGFGIPSFFLLLSLKLISYTDTIVVGLQLSAEAVALYSFPLQLIGHGTYIIGGIVGALLPSLTVMQSHGGTERLRDAYLRVGRVSCFLAAFLNVNLVFLGPPFLERWIGPGYGTPVAWVLVFLGASSSIHVLSIQAAVPFYQALRRVRVPCVVMLLEGAMNLILSLALAPRYGLNGVAFATFLPAVLVGALLLPPYLHRVLGVSNRAAAAAILWPAVLVATLASLVHLGMGVALDQASYPIILVKCLATLPIAGVVFVATFPAEDRDFVVAALRKVKG